MIGRFELDPPAMEDDLSQMVESHRAKTGQDYGAILLFGLWGTVDCSPEVRLYAAYRHLEEHSEDGAAWLETSRVHLENGEPDKAMAIIDELERLDAPNLYPNLYSEDPDVHRAHILADSGRFDQALEIFDALRTKHGDSPVYHFSLASVLQQKGDFDGATASYDEALEALDDFRREIEEEDLGEDMSVDFAAAGGYIAAARSGAEKKRPFDGERHMDLSGFREE